MMRQPPARAAVGPAPVRRIVQNKMFFRSRPTPFPAAPPFCVGSRLENSPNPPPVFGVKIVEKLFCSIMKKMMRQPPARAAVGAAPARRIVQNKSTTEDVMGNNYCLYHMDCLRAMAQMEDHSVDLVLTDPPYNLGLFMKSRATNLKAMRKNFFGAAGWDAPPPHLFALDRV